MKCGKGRDTRNVGRKKYTQYGSLEITRNVEKGKKGEYGSFEFHEYESLETWVA